MKSKFAFLVTVVALASCATPKYTYYFDHQRYGSKPAPSPAGQLSASTDEIQLIAPSTETESALATEEVASAVPAISYSSLTPQERKALRHEIKERVKEYKKATKKTNHAVQSTQASMDNDLKLAAIFGVVGVVGLIIGGNVFYIIGGIALLIGAVFFVKWLIRQ